MRHSLRHRLALPLVLAPLVAGSACAHVSQDDFDTRLETLRRDMAQEIQQGDQETRTALATRMDGLESRLDGLRAELEALQEQFDVRIEELETAVRFNVPVYFGFDEATIQPSGRTVLERFSSVVDGYYDGAHITVEGFTDPAGPASYNLELGQRRAEAVKSYLTDAGISAERIRAVSYGEDTQRLVAPDAAGPGTEGWENRRVVIVIDHLGTVPAVVTEEGAGTLS